MEERTIHDRWDPRRHDDLPPDTARDELREELGEVFKVLSGRPYHAPSCATNVAPALSPGPCDCWGDRSGPLADLLVDGS